MPAILSELFPAFLAFALAFGLTPVVRASARRLGIVARPRGDRWHKKPTALLGGIAIFAAVLVTYLVHFPRGQADLVLGASSLLFLLGLLDDLVRLKPYQKLIGQMIGAAVLISGGLVLPWTPSPLGNMLLTLFWLIGITNAVNLLDNMDGLAAGIVAIAAGFLVCCFLDNDQPLEAALVGMFAAALGGFLVYNWNPASIFMGDCGSLFIGFFVAGAALLCPGGGRARSFLPVLAVPVLVLVIPIFDVCLVTVMRKLAGRRVSQGGRDHTSHRLVALGLSERHAVWLLYALAIASGGLALATRETPTDLGLLLVLGFTLALTLLGIHVARVQVYAEDEGPRARSTVTSFLVDLSYKRRIFEIFLDVLLICLAYGTANVLFHGPAGDDGFGALFPSPLPLLILLKLSGFLAAGVYRGLWRYVSFSDLITYAKAVALGSGLSVLVVLGLYRFHGFSRTVFAYDAAILFLLLAGSRGAFRLLRTLLPAPPLAGARRVLIFGAGDAGDLLLREMKNNPELGCVPVGFADDDPLKQGKIIHGLRVFGGNGSLPEICATEEIAEVYISSKRVPAERVREIQDACTRLGVTLKRLHLSFETLAGTEKEALA